MPLEPRIIQKTDPLVTGAVSCPFDSVPFTPGDQVVVCDVCKTAHHVNCWQANGNHCTTLGCTGAGRIVIPTITKEELENNPRRPAVKWILALVLNNKSGRGLNVEQMGIVTRALAKLTQKPSNLIPSEYNLIIQYELSCPTILDVHVAAHNIIDSIKPELQEKDITISSYTVQQQKER